MVRRAGGKSTLEEEVKRWGIVIVLLACGLATMESQTRVDAQLIIATAREYIGCPYSYGATGPSKFDCSGLTSVCFAKHGIRLPRTSAAQSEEGTRVPKGWDNLQAGDLLFFGSSHVSHVGIYVGKSGAGKHEFIHASSSLGVTISALEERYWTQHYLFAKRLDLVASEPIKEPRSTVNSNSKYNSSSNSRGTVDDLESGIDFSYWISENKSSTAVTAVDGGMQYKSRKWKMRVQRKNRKKVVWED